MSITNTFTSMYLHNIFEEIDAEMRKMNVYVFKDPSYYNKRGECRFMITTQTRTIYNESVRYISDKIRDYLYTVHPKKLKRNPKAPPPLNIII